MRSTNQTLVHFRYCYPRDPNFVNYAAFSNEIESIFTTKGLEKTPTADVDVFVPPGEVGVSPLSPEEGEIFHRVMQKLADKVSSTVSYFVEAKNVMLDLDSCETHSAVSIV